MEAFPVEFLMKNNSKEFHKFQVYGIRKVLKREKMKRKIILVIFFAAILVAALFVKNKIFDGKLTCTGVITNRIGEWEYESDCFIVIDSKYGGPWIVYESLEEINERFHQDLAYGDRVWVSYTTDGYEIAPGLMDVNFIMEIGK